MQPDLLQRIAAPLRALIERRLIAVAPGSVEALASLLDMAGLAMVGIVLATLCRGLGSMATASSPRARALGAGIPAAAGFVALGLLIWILRHPSMQFEGIFTRWDHLALCALGGLAAAAAPSSWRKVSLTAMSIAFLLQYYGLQAVVPVGAMGLLGFALLRTSLAARPWALALAQGGLIVGAYCYALWVRSGSVGMAAFPLQGMLAFAALRHISFVVEASRTPRPLRDYAAFMSFYPGVVGIFGAPEVYSEFSRRNLVRPVAIDHARAARRIAVGATQAWVALRIPVSADTVLASPAIAMAWASAAVFFIRTALAVMGGWSMIDGAALFLGVQLRANFRGLLTCQNPSELWWSWRGTLTNWLVQHVYGPLGGRRRLVRNILAAFAASFLWHAVGVPFATTNFHLVQVVPVAVWAGINATAVLLHALLSRSGPGTRPPGSVGRAGRIVLMWWLGAMTPLLLSFQGDAVTRFPALLRTLLGWSAG